MAADIGEFTTWSTTASSNQPDSTDSVINIDDNFRQIQATLRTYLATKGSDIASATTTDLSTATGNYVHITGTTTITGLGTVSAGISLILVFDGALTFTHNATSLILPGSANITTAAGDRCLVTSLGSGNWRCMWYQKASGEPVAYDAGLNDIAGLAVTDGNIIVGNGANWVAESGATARASLGLTIGTDVQAYDADTAKLDVDQAWTGSQRGTPTTDNDLSFDLTAANNFTCTPTGGGTLTFTNMASATGQSGFIKLVNGSNYTIALAATTKGATNLSTIISATGTYILSYYCDGTNVYVVSSAAMV